MTTPESPPQEPTTAQKAAAAAVVALALIAVEARVRGDVEDAVAAILTAWGALLLVVIGSVRVLSGSELMSRREVYSGLQSSMKAGRLAVSTAVRSGYTSGAQITKLRSESELRQLGHEVPNDMPDLGDLLEDLLDDVDNAWGNTQTDLQQSIQVAFDSITREDSLDAQMMAVSNAIKSAVVRAQQRARASAVTAVHQGANDAQLAILQEFAAVNPYIRLRKRWRVMATDPCKMCSALDGAVLALDAEFDHRATDGESSSVKAVWGNLQGPPRHPNCRCQIELVTD